MQPIVKEDLLSYRFLSGIAASPFEEKAVFSVAVQDTKSNTYKTNLYCLDLATEKVEKLTSHGKSGAFLFNGPGVLLCQKKSKKPYQTDYEYFHLDSKKAEPAFTIPYPVNKLEKLYGSLYLVNADVDINRDETLSDAEQKAEEDYIKIQELPFWDNGVGYVSGHRDTLFLFDSATGSLQRLTDLHLSVGNVAVSPDKEDLYFTGYTYTQAKYDRNALYHYHLPQGKLTQVIPQGTLRIGQLQFVDKTMLVADYYCDKLGGTEKNDWYTLTPDGLKKVLDNDYTIGCNISTDCRYGRSAALGAYQGGLLYLSTYGKVCSPKLLNANGELPAPFSFDGAVNGIAVKGQNILFIAMKKGELQELYLFDGKAVRQITQMNTDALSDKYVGQPEYCGFTNSQGTWIDGWVIRPFGYQEGNQYPALLSMHGGPCVAWGELFVHEMQMLASMGYFVFFCNPRGSDGRGAKFADIKNKYGTVDFEDFMEFTDHVLECYPQIDSGRLGVLGGSYGGFMTNWIIGNTTRFAAAVSQRSFCNPISDFGNSCIGYTFDAKEFAATPWNGLDRMWDHAPLKYAPNVKTPTLFIHSLEDYNCPLSQGFEMFTALKYHGVTSEMVLFHGENHELSRSGKPLHRMRRLAEISRWFETYLK